jgi:hypothetical protein
VSFILKERHGHVTPSKGKCSHSCGGLIDVAQPTPDVVVITMTGGVVRNASMQFDLEQCFALSYDDPKVKRSKLTLEGRVVGLLRGEKKGCAEYTVASAEIVCDHASLVPGAPGAGAPGLIGISVPPHSVCGCDSLSVNDHDGPHCAPGLPCPCKYILHQAFSISAHTDSFICKGPSAEFAPDPALDPLWINYWEPFHGVKKDGLGFQVTLKVTAETEDSNGDKKPEEVPAPKAAGPKGLP